MRDRHEARQCEGRTEASLNYDAMDALTWFGFLSLTAMLICYALEDRSHWYMLGFAIGCVLGSIYGFLQGAWPFGVVEAIWTFVALRRWQRARKPALA